MGGGIHLGEVGLEFVRVLPACLAVGEVYFDAHGSCEDVNGGDGGGDVFGVGGVGEWEGAFV